MYYVQQDAVSSLAPAKPKQHIDLGLVWPRAGNGQSSSSSAAAAVPRKGHFAVYTEDGERIVVPIAYLKSGVFRELFRLSEEEFGPPATHRPITLPYGAAFVEQLVASLRDGSSKI